MAVPAEAARDVVAGQGLVARDDVFGVRELSIEGLDFRPVLENLALDDAHKLFDEMPQRDLITWTALLLIPRMLRHGLQPNQFTLVRLLKAAATVVKDVGWESTFYLKTEGKLSLPVGLKFTDVILGVVSEVVSSTEIGSVAQLFGERNCLCMSVEESLCVLKEMGRDPILGKTGAYMLPLAQRLRREEAENGMVMKPWYPRAVVLCPTRELGKRKMRNRRDGVVRIAGILCKGSTMPPDDFKVGSHRVEVCLKPSSTARIDDVRLAVERMLEKRSLSYIDGPVAVPSDDLFLTENVERICICDTDEWVQNHDILLFWQARPVVQVFQLSKEGACEDVSGDGHPSTFNEWILPAKEFDGMWESLIYESGLKSRLLRYAASALHFTEQGVNHFLVSWNRIVLLHGPPGTGKTSLCKALAQKLSICSNTKVRLEEMGKKIIFTNVGNPHALGQKPLTFPRQVVALCQVPFLLDDPNVGLLFPADAISRAKHYLSVTSGGLGAYSDSRGIPAIRKEVAEFIEKRDGYSSDPELIFLTDGASKGVMQILNAVIRGERDGILVPVPQYPLYSAVISLFGGSLVSYHLAKLGNTHDALRVIDIILRQKTAKVSEDGSVNEVPDPTAISVLGKMFGEAVAYGAAVQAAILSGEGNEIPELTAREQSCLRKEISTLNISSVIVVLTVNKMDMCFLELMVNVSKALEVSKMMETAGIKHDMKTYSMLINGFLKLKDWANAFAVIEDLMKDGLKPDVVRYNNIITAFCGMGNMNRAVRTVKEMQRGRHRSTSRTFMPIIHGFARAGDMRRALEIFDMMRMSGCIPTVHTFNALVLGLVEKRQMEKAVEILDEMALTGISPNEHTYTTIMNGYASLGDTGKAFEYFSILRNDGLEIDVFTIEEMKTFGVKPNIKTCTTLIQGWARASLPKKALRCLEDMKLAGLKPYKVVYHCLMTSLLSRATVAEAYIYSGLLLAVGGYMLELRRVIMPFVMLLASHKGLVVKDSAVNIILQGRLTSSDI